MNTQLTELCTAYGVARQYLDCTGEYQEAPDETCTAILKSMGLDIQSNDDIENHLARFRAQQARRRLPDTLIVENDNEYHLSGDFHLAPDGGSTDWYILQEDGTRLKGATHGDSLTLPALPLGVHTLSCCGDTCCLLSAPNSLPSPPRGWGVMVPLYGLRSDRNRGIGDFHDLAEFSSHLGPLGAGFAGLNPVHAGFIYDPEAFSPYSPSSRQWLNPLHIAVDQLPEWPEIADQFEAPEAMGELVDYESVLERKIGELKAAYAVFRHNDDVPEFARFVEAGAESLQCFATHQALSEVHGPYWKNWPVEFQSSDSDATRQFASDNKSLLEYYCWLQWSASRQLEAAQSKAVSSGMVHGLYLDLAVGTHPDGAETWADGSTFVRGVSIGAPPDQITPAGQNWNLAPINPQELVARQFSPLIDTLRAQLSYSGVLRIDHIIAFEHSFWIPEGLPGTYVKYPRDALLAVVRIEAARAKACIIGEDLGILPAGLRDALMQSGVFGCRIAIFERYYKGDKSYIRPEKYTRQALASITTHDTPTFKGWWTGRDIEWREKLGEFSNQEALEEKQQRRCDCDTFIQALRLSNKLASDDINLASMPAPVLAAYQFLAETHSELVAIQIEDVLELVEQPNLPGTVYDHPNWRRVLPKTAEEIARLPLMRDIAAAMKEAGRQ